MLNKDRLRPLRDALRKNFLKWFVDQVDGCVDRKIKEMDELIDWLDQSTTAMAVVSLWGITGGILLLVARSIHGNGVDVSSGV